MNGHINNSNTLTPRGGQHEGRLTIQAFINVRASHREIKQKFV